MKSMTGFGAAEAAVSKGKLRVEIRSLNHRFLDIRVRVPRAYQVYEARLYQWLKERIERGRVDLCVQMVEDVRDASTSPCTLNRRAVEGYLDLVRQIKETYGVPGELDVKTLLCLPEVTRLPEETDGAEGDLAALLKAAEEALSAMEGMKEAEGEAICRDIRERLARIDGCLRQIEVVSSQVPARVKERLERAISRLTSLEQVDPDRVAEEVVFHAERSDITEEIVRLKSHMDQLGHSLSAGTLSGKRLEFLLHEMQREVTTMAAKGQDTSLVHCVVDIKMELEKIREQAQNLQ